MGNWALFLITAWMAEVRLFTFLHCLASDTMGGVRLPSTTAFVKVEVPIRQLERLIEELLDVSKMYELPGFSKAW